LAEILAQNQVHDIILSPGSRCAPMVIAFNRHSNLNCKSIVDERVAAFTALGMAQQKQHPVALVCTSGTALLNYSPAIAEAYYQQIPLIILSSDRPPQRIDQNDGQTMRQKNVFQNFIKASFELPCEPNTDNDIYASTETIKEALSIATTAPHGPVHINIPFEEPLYELIEYKAINEQLTISPQKSKLNFDEPLNEIVAKWNQYSRKMILCGQLLPNDELAQILTTINKDESVIVLAETTSNLPNKDFFNQYDRLVFSLNENNIKTFQPDLILTIGNAIVSKKVKQVFKKHPPKHHWHIGFSQQAHDIFNCLEKKIEVDPASFLTALKAATNPISSDYKTTWQKFDAAIETQQQQYINSLNFSDFIVMDYIYQHLPQQCMLQLGNSTPVRYSNLWKIPNSKIDVYSNRGVSGIDGQSSTAIGAAIASKKLTICITGDLGFFYDSNAFWSHHIPDNIKVVLINNGGGGIFRFINGPSALPELEQFFETQHHTSAEHIAKAYSINYLFCNNFDELKTNWKALIDSVVATILEIKTDGEYSAKVLKDYFKSLNGS